MGRRKTCSDEQPHGKYLRPTQIPGRLGGRGALGKTGAKSTEPLPGSTFWEESSSEDDLVSARAFRKCGMSQAHSIPPPRKFQTGLTHSHTKRASPAAVGARRVWIFSERWARLRGIVALPGLGMEPYWDREPVIHDQAYRFGTRTQAGRRFVRGARAPQRI